MPVLSALLAACASGASAPSGTTRSRLPAEEPRVVTAGAALLDLVPAGADAIAELDLARLRRNEVLSVLVETAAAAAAERAAELGIDPLRDLDVVVAAAYRVGGADAATLFLLRGATLDPARVPGAVVLDEHTAAIGPPELCERAGRTRAVTDDAHFMSLRDAAMPARAPGAFLRLTARLTNDARIDVAGRLGIDEAPATISLWADVADDLALVAYLGADGPEDAARLAAAVEEARERVRRATPLALGLRQPLARLTAEAHGDVARVVWLVGPRALRAWVGDLCHVLGCDAG